MEGIHWNGIYAVIAMYAVFLGVGWRAGRRVKAGSAEEMLVAGRAMPVWLATMTMTATWVDGGYILGTAEGTFTSLASGLQGGLCFGISLILGGIFFAPRMRASNFTTLIDPFEKKYGKRWAAVLSTPALLGEILWSAELLVAIGATFSVLLRVDLSTAIILSAAVVTLYTMLGGIWSVAYTDAIQLALIPIGLLVSLPFALEEVGGLSAAFTKYQAALPKGMSVTPLFTQSAWWDLSAMLILGGIPWNCYFQRVLSCQSPAKARTHSLFAGVLTILLTLPPLLLGVVAVTYWGIGNVEAPLSVPLILRDLVPEWVGILGLGAIVGAVTSSFSSSILSAGSMVSWNWYQGRHYDQMKLVIRLSIILLGGLAVVIALGVRGVQALWFLSADLVFVLLFPQLVMALFDPMANGVGSVSAFCLSLVLRLGGGEPLFGIAPFFHYPTWLPYKTLAAVLGLITIPMVSRLARVAGLAFQKLRTEKIIAPP